MPKKADEHFVKKQDALDAIRELHSDTTVSRATTKESLKECQELIEEFLADLANDDE